MLRKYEQLIKESKCIYTYGKRNVELIYREADRLQRIQRLPNAKCEAQIDVCTIM